MPPNTRDPAYLWDMMNSAEAIVIALEGVDLKRYLQDENLTLIIERRIEIIGEAARRLSSDFHNAHPEIPWRLIIAMRNVLVHEYDEIDHERIWRLAMDEIPRLINQLRSLIRQFNENDDL